MDEQIMIWIADYCAGNISAEDFEQLRAWMESSPRHRAELKACLDAHRAAMELTLVDHLDHRGAWRQLLKAIAPRRYKRRVFVRWTSAAAVVVGVFVASWAWWHGEGDASLATALPGSTKATLLLPEGQRFQLDGDVTLAMSGERLSVEDRSVALLEEVRQAPPRAIEDYHLLAVPRGGEYQLALADGTRVWLNSDSRLRFPLPFAAGEREVYLDGEAYFEVQRDEERPFIVRTDAGTVRVLGTAFNVSVYPEKRGIVTTLVTGKVVVAAGEALVHLAPGEQAAWREGDERFSVQAVDAAHYTSWIKGVFEFEDTALCDILAYLSRWYNVDFEFADQEVAALRFTGGAKKYRPLEEFLRVIERSCEVQFNVKNTVIHVSANN
jgi:ferric-dicitrate binding protein FerR (iron transport regulator)